MFAFYTFLLSLYNCLLKFILLVILLGEVRKFLGEMMKISGEVQNHSRPWCLYFAMQIVDTMT